MRAGRALTLAALALAALAWTTAASAEAPERSIRPAPRALAADEVVASAPEAGAPEVSRRGGYDPSQPVRVTAARLFAVTGSGASGNGSDRAASALTTIVAANAAPPLRPRPRLASALAVPAAAVTAPVAATTVTVVEGPAATRPRPRPAAMVRPVNLARAVVVVPAASRNAVLRSPRPKPRPDNLRRLTVVRASGMVPTQPNPGAILGRRGSVCGDPRIRGETIAPIAGRLQGCGLDEAVRVTEVDGVRLSTPVTIDCTTASALERWVSDTVKPAVGRRGGGVASLEVFAHYSCRTRNNQRGARISEHGRGRAIDIGAINLANGSSISVLDDWRSGDLGVILKAMHRGACGPFRTVLGPAADRFHQNHLHLDTARGRSNAYCR